MLIAHNRWFWRLIWSKEDSIEADTKIFAKIDDPIDIILNLLIALPAVDSYISFIVALGLQLLERVEAYGMLTFFCNNERVLSIYHFWTALEAASGELDLFFLHY